MRGVTVFFVLVVVVAVLAAVAVGIYYFFFRRKRDVHIPTRDSYPSSSYPSGTTWTQTREIHRLPPAPLSYPRTSYRSPATHVHNQAVPRTPAPSDDGVYHPSVASPHAGTQSQTQRSSGRTQPSSTRKPPSSARKQPSSTRAQLSPHIPTHEPIESESRLPTAPTVAWPDSHSGEPASARKQTNAWTPAPPDYGLGVYHSSVASPHVQTPRLSSNRTHHVPSCVHTRSEPPLPTVVQVISSDLHSDEPASAEDLDFAKKLREQARRKGREMSEARSRAKSARKKRYGGGAQAHNREAIAHEKAMKELNKQAAKIIFTEKNKNRKEGMIDLHGLYVPEALQFAKDQVQAAESRGDEVVQFIVGKGLHSDAGGAKIRPALEEHFTRRGLKHSRDPKNAGVLIVSLDGQ